MKIKKQISMIMADLSYGHINIFRGDTRGLCFSGKLYPFKKIYLFKELIFVQVQGHMFIQGNYTC